MRFIKLILLSSLLATGCYEVSEPDEPMLTEDEICRQIYISRRQCINAILQQHNRCLDQGKSEDRCLREYAMQYHVCEVEYRQRTTRFQEFCGFEDFGVRSDAIVSYGDE